MLAKLTRAIVTQASQSLLEFSLSDSFICASLIKVAIIVQRDYKLFIVCFCWLDFYSFNETNYLSVPSCVRNLILLVFCSKFYKLTILLI